MKPATKDKHALHRIEEPEQPKSAPPPPAPLWTLGMRPFYLAAAAYAAIAILLWVASLAGWWLSPIHDPRWHAHEMIFGYVLAAVVGFLFTAVRNWTQQSTPTGMHLKAIVGLWLAARLLLLISPALSAIADLAFIVAVIAGIAGPLLRAGNRRNYQFPLVLVGIGAANALFHLAMAGVLDLRVSLGLTIALDLVLFLVVVVGGRVIPSFTANGTGIPARPNRWVERVAPAIVLILLAEDALGLSGIPVMITAFIALLAHGARLVLWRPLTTRAIPLLWILHAAYFWVVVHFALRALSAVGLVSPGIATHALTVGAIGSLTLGMMTRTARGHMGWPLRTETSEVAIYVLVLAAATVRVLLPLAFPACYVNGMVVSGLAWAAAFSLYVWRYWPILSGPDLRR